MRLRAGDAAGPREAAAHERRMTACVHLQPRRGLPVSLHPRGLGRVQQLRAAGGADRRRPWTFVTSEALYQAAKFAAAPEVQRRIACAPTAREAAAIGRGTPDGLNPDWNAQRVNAMRWVLRMKREANAAAIDAALARSGDRPIVEVSTRDPWWGAKPAGDTYRGENVLGRLWMELRRQLRDGDPASRAAAWTARIDVGRLADPPCA